MSLKNYLKEVWGRAQQYSIFDEFEAAELEIARKYSKTAYQFCVAVYGRPLDPQTPYFLKRATRGTSFCRKVSGRYYLAIDKDAKSHEQLCHHVAHEMYHRVTYHRKGFAGTMWVDEMLATHTERGFLNKQGFNEYVEARKKALLKIPGKADAVLLRKSVRRNFRGWFLRGEAIYSEAFDISLMKISYAIGEIVDGNDICRIANANTLEEWIDILPAAKQYSVCRILELSSDGRELPEDMENIIQFYRALKAKGDPEVTVAEFQTIAGFYPTNGTVAFYLADAYEFAKESDAALATYIKAYDLGFTDHWLPSNVGKIYYRRKEYALAIEWFQRSIESKPDWATGHYFLGNSLNGLGEVCEAHKAWNKALTLDDEKFKDFARQAIEENPLPENEIILVTPPESVPAGKSLCAQS